MKNPDTLDTLIASKEQTDKALAELADELCEKLNRLEAVIGDDRRQTADCSRGAPAPFASVISLASAAVYNLPSITALSSLSSSACFCSDNISAATIIL